MKNAGDFLIGKRAYDLINHIRPDREVVIGKGWLPLREQFPEDILANFKAIILSGGPGYLPNMYPDIYPLVPDAASYKIPIYLLGLGVWMSGKDYESQTPYIFNESSRELLTSVEKKAALGVRDLISFDVLKKNGLENVQLNGCPAWFNMQSLYRSMEFPSKINNIVFTPPASIAYLGQAKNLLIQLMKTFPISKIIVSFHRGYACDKYTNKDAAEAYTSFANCSRDIGCTVEDISYSEKGFKAYDDFDIHIGYRVHAHIYFLSLRKISCLIAEDSRGLGVKECLGGLVNKGWVSKTPELIDQTLPERFMDIFLDERKKNFMSYAQIPYRIDSTWDNSMKPFVLNLP